MNIDEIMRHLPHRYPFLMIDRVVHLDPGKTATAIKNVSIDEPFFQGHFPGHPIMPGVLIVEALAQTGGIAFASAEENIDEADRLGLPILAKIEEMRFRAAVSPGDQLWLHAEVLRAYESLAMVKVEAKVNDSTVAQGKIVLAKGP
ncbi:MAG: 3-hydroxyacyl-ACP dehydratase FabZ [Deltaproteobacteria bacterium]|nr:3-hydroxyacyl-ACP dehydratase FabZ [Deltaproteobacteria bacterium]